MTSIGVLTIGQAPRADLVSAFARNLAGTGIEAVHGGALDELSDARIARELAPGPDETAYVTSLRSGPSPELAKARLIPLMQQRIREMEERCSAIAIVCTGSFPTLESSVPLLATDRILVDAVRGRGLGGPLGIVVPLAHQADDIAAKWAPLGLNLLTADATPYGPSDLAGAASSLAERGAGLIVLDCMGYSPEHARTAAEASGLDVLIPQDVVPQYVLGRFADGG